jgi:hypothetical protein
LPFKKPAYDIIFAMNMLPKNLSKHLCSPDNVAIHPAKGFRVDTRLRKM